MKNKWFWMIDWIRKKITKSFLICFYHWQSHAVTLTVLTVKTGVTKITSERKGEEDELHLLCHCISLGCDLALYK